MLWWFTLHASLVALLLGATCMVLCLSSSLVLPRCGHMFLSPNFPSSLFRWVVVPILSPRNPSVPFSMRSEAEFCVESIPIKCVLGPHATSAPSCIESCLLFSAKSESCADLSGSVTLLGLTWKSGFLMRSPSLSSFRCCGVLLPYSLGPPVPCRPPAFNHSPYGLSVDSLGFVDEHR